MSELDEWQATHTVELGVRAESPLLYDQPQTQSPMPNTDRRCGTCRHYVYVRLARPEGYEDVASALVVEDAIPDATFLPEDVTDYVRDLVNWQKSVEKWFE